MTGVLVHEWLEQIGGSEKVLDRFAALYPDAPIHALWNNAPDRFEPGRVTETWLARTPLRRSKALALPLMPATWRALGRRDAEWILCSSHLFAHHARFKGPARDAPKYSYIYTPARYIWDPELDERGDSLVARIASPPLQRIDRKRAHESHSVVGISDFVAERIRECWGIDAQVIYPPVEVEAFINRLEAEGDEARIIDALPSEYLLGASRLVKYKRLDLVIEAGEATGLPVVIAGSGPERANLERLANERGVAVQFIDRPSHALLVELYRRCIAFVFPAIEDFGIMPVEAMATGTPVIGRTIGGVAETVVDGVTGALVESFSTTELRHAVARISTLDRAKIVERAWEFDVAVFDQKVRNWLPSKQPAL